MNIAILTNFSDGSPAQKSNAIAEIILGVESEEENISMGPINTIKISSKALLKFEEFYWNDASNYSRKIYLKNDTLRYFRSESSENPIVPIGKDEFQMLGLPANLKIKFSDEEGKSMMTLTIDDGEPIVSQAYTPVDPGKLDLALYTGTYYSPEHETKAAIVVQVHHTLSKPTRAEYYVRRV